MKPVLPSSGTRPEKSPVGRPSHVRNCGLCGRQVRHQAAPFKQVPVRLRTKLWIALIERSKTCLPTRILET